VSQAVCTVSSAYRQALNKKVVGTIWRGYHGVSAGLGTDIFGYRLGIRLVDKGNR